MKYDFPKTSIVTETERDFLHLHTPNAVLEMIQDGSYDSKLAAFLNIGDPPKDDESVVVTREIFAKSLTRSDVGKRKGLVMAKKDAEECFPEVRRCEGESMTLRFLDRRTKQWMNFRFCFYRSSNSYVLTTGWCLFVKANCLKEKDIIRFFECAKDGTGERYVMIDVARYRGDEEGEVVTNGSETRTTRKRRHRKGEKGEVKMARKKDAQGEGVRLFGVVIG